MNSSSELHLHNSKVIRYFYLYIAWIEFILIIILNALVGIVILKKRKIRQQKCNIHFLFLLLSHFLIGVCGLIETTWSHFTNDITLHHIHNKSDPRVVIATVYFCVQLSAFSNMVLVVLDRFLAVKYSYFYDRLSKGCSISTTFVFSAVPIVLIVIAWLGNDVYYALIAFNIYTLSIGSFTVYVHMSIYVQTKTQFKKIIKNVVLDDKLMQITERRRLLYRQTRSLFISLLLILSYSVAWIPTYVIVIIFLVGGDVTPTAKVLTYACLCLNSIADPIIYAFFNKSVKSEFNFCKRGKVEPAPS